MFNARFTPSYISLILYAAIIQRFSDELFTQVPEFW